MKTLKRKKLKFILRIIFALLLALCLIASLIMPVFASYKVTHDLFLYNGIIKTYYEKNSGPGEGTSITPWRGNEVTMTASSFCDIPYSSDYFHTYANKVVHGSISLHIQNVTSETIYLKIVTSGSTYPQISTADEIAIGSNQFYTITVKTTGSDVVNARNTNVTVSGTVKILEWSYESSKTPNAINDAGSEWGEGWNDALRIARTIAIPLCVLCVAIGGLMMFAPTLIGGDSPERTIQKGKGIISVAVIALICLLLLPAVIRLAIALFGDTQIFKVWNPPAKPSSRPQ